MTYDELKNEVDVLVQLVNRVSARLSEERLLPATWVASENAQKQANKVGHMLVEEERK